MLFIEPADAGRTEERQSERRPHLLYSCKDQGLATGNFTDTGEMPPVTADPHPRRRRRRSTGRKRYLEVQLVVDHTITAMHSRSRVKAYVMTLMNIANAVYQHPSLGVNLRVVVTELILLEKEQQRDVLIKKDAYRTVQKFCTWAMYRKSASFNAKHDISVLLTREKLGPAGYAPITGLCNPSRACAAITDEGFTSGFIIAHEMAHVFGLFHDGHGNACSGRRYTTAIMAPLVEAKLNHYWWSDCSKQQMQHVINYLYCLNDEPDLASDVDHYDLDSGHDLDDEMGKDYSLDFQCRLEFGNRFGLCSAFHADSCDMLWCSDRNTPQLCRTKRGPPVPGSHCGYERQCRDRRCSYVGNEKAVHGDWAAWSSWGECSVQCGTGIKRRRRFCTNPKPAFGGRECEGEDETWDTCVAEDCDTFYDSREAHCAVWNDMDIRPGQHDWKSYQTKKESERCKQTCVSSVTREVLTIDVVVSDGTPCDYDDPSNICYLGTCLSVGCDGLQNSTKDYDSCGICGGDNSQCKTVSGRFSRPPKAEDKYESIVYLPKGARDIEVIKQGAAKHFIALKEADYGRYPLNGAKTRESSRDFIVSGARFEYESKYDRQSLKSRGPIQTNLEVMLYPNGDKSKASVTYKYSINKNDFTLERRKYKWMFKDWSQCSVTCGEGVTSIMHACYDKDTQEEQDDEKCQFLEPPRQDEAPCSREPCSRTRYMWSMTNDWSACSAEECSGEEGEETQGYICQRHHLDNDTFEDVGMEMCDQDSTPAYTRNCTAPPCRNLDWTIGHWSECSVTCGKGRQFRTVYCGDPDTDSDDIYCKDIPPALSRGCEKRRCKGVQRGDECLDKYSFCAKSNGLNFKCRSKRFNEICCLSCQRQQSAARRPKLSHWAMYRRRMLERRY
ncbi:A disintegrin and metalloproteinase with thrombospondin motifs 3-like isoform X2 [Littorina saxatilis]